jgi:hypothetical protein
MQHLTWTFLPQLAVSVARMQQSANYMESLAVICCLFATARALRRLIGDVRALGGHAATDLAIHGIGWCGVDFVGRCKRGAGLEVLTHLGRPI